MCELAKQSKRREFPVNNFSAKFKLLSPLLSKIELEGLNFLENFAENLVSREMKFDVYMKIDEHP